MHLASLQVLDVLDVEDGFCLPDLSSWSEHLRMWVPRVSIMLFITPLAILTRISVTLF